MREDFVAYLKSRGYTDEMIQKEEIVEISSFFSMGDISFEVDTPLIGWVCRSMSGALIGVNTRRIDDKKYRWFESPSALHLPVLYGSEEDWEILYRTREMFVTEGVFDRVILKRVCPEKAVFARLSKGIPAKLVNTTRRYCDKLWTCFDMDAGGESATESVKKKLDDIELCELQYPRKDLGDLYKANGIDYVTTLLRKEINAQDFGV